MRKYDMWPTKMFTKYDVVQISIISVGRNDPVCLRNEYYLTATTLLKHIDVKYQILVVDLVKNANVSMYFVPMQNMLSDVCTNYLMCINFTNIIDFRECSSTM